MKNVLLGIDFQNDFVLKGAPLVVPCATVDAFRAARFIRKNGNSLDKIFLTQDYHPVFHISHPCFWKVDGDINQQPALFVVIKAVDVESGKYLPVDGNVDFCLAYLHGLEAKNEVHVIWPLHCIAGTIGACIYGEIRNAVTEFETKYHTAANFVIKGTNPYHEMHSPFCYADYKMVYACENKETMLELDEADRIFVCGEAYSHCLKKTVEDMIAWGINASKITILEDCTSAITGFDMTAWKAEMQNLGVVFATSFDNFQF